MGRQSLILTSADERILGALWRYHYLGSQQVQRLLYSPGSLTLVQSRMKRLTELGFTQRLWIPKRTPRGSTPAVYTLARRGLNHLRTEYSTTRRFHPSEQRSLSYLFLSHTLELNDFLIAAELLCRWSPEFRLAGLVHERDLKRHPAYVTDDSGRRCAVIPDAWIDLRIQESFQVCLVVELDRGTEEQKRWRQKVSHLLAYASGPYQELFETRSLTIAVVTTAGEWRLRELLNWTQDELEARREASQADLFLFTSANPGQMDAERMFLKPVWFQPTKQAPIALLETTWT